MTWWIALSLLAAFCLGAASHWVLTMWQMWKWYANKR